MLANTLAVGWHAEDSIPFAGEFTSDRSTNHLVKSHSIAKWWKEVEIEQLVANRT